MTYLDNTEITVDWQFLLKKVEKKTSGEGLNITKLNIR